MNASEPTDPTTTLATRAWGAVTGLVAALVGLAAAEVVTLLADRWQSPVLDVGDRVVDGVPNSVKELAIDWFGTNDKIALLVGIASLLGVYAAVMGVIAARRESIWRAAIAGIALFGLIGAYASQSTRRGADFSAVVPSLVGGLAAAGALVGLRKLLLASEPLTHPLAAGIDDQSDSSPTDDERWSRPLDDESEDSGIDADSNSANDDRDEWSVSRRQFVATTAGAAAGAAVIGTTARRLGTSNTSIAGERSSVSLPQQIASPAPPRPDGIEVAVDGMQPFVTPNDNFYRIDTALTVPQVSVDNWQLRVHGLVDNEITLNFDELLQRESIERDITMTCVSNEVGGNLVGHARWLGFRLDELLDEAGVQGDADQIVGRSTDGYTCGFPVAALDGRDAMIAVGMNGEPLPAEHGYPARLIVPGLYGYVSATKWLTEIELTRFDDFDQYWVERDWDVEAPIKTQSRIDTPRGLAKLPAGTVAVAGVAWAQTRGIEGVQLQIDDGDWFDVELADELNDVSWRQWSYAWDATPGRHSIRVRAIERGGAIQTDERTEPFPNGAAGRHNIIVIVE